MHLIYIRFALIVSTICIQTEPSLDTLLPLFSLILQSTFLQLSQGLLNNLSQQRENLFYPTYRTESDQPLPVVFDTVWLVFTVCTIDSSTYNVRRVSIYSFLVSPQKHMLWILIRSILVRHFNEYPHHMFLWRTYALSYQQVI